MALRRKTTRIALVSIAAVAVAFCLIWFRQSLWFTVALKILPDRISVVHLGKDAGDNPLPKITPAIVSEIQRLAITLRIAEFPLPQQEYRQYLALPPFQMVLGVGGRGMRMHEICALTDPDDPLGYYGFNLYWGERQTEAPNYPVVARIELFFQPRNMGVYPPMRQMILPTDTPATANPQATEFLRVKMHERHQTPGEFVNEWYKR